MATTVTATQEAAHLVLEGLRQVTLAQMNQDLADMGYKLDRNGDCSGTATYVSGVRQGQSYRNLSLSVREIDSGKRAFHYQARRDANFKRMQAYRDEAFAIVLSGRHEYIASI